MTEATIAFARGDASVKETRTVDPNALVGSLCDDLAEMHQPVIYREGEQSATGTARTAFAAPFTT